MICTALFALAWAVARAATQSITIDEADTYLQWVDRPGQLWAQISNNHILNSLLMRLSTWLFGLSEITVRLPALVGAALYNLGIPKDSIVRYEAALKTGKFVLIAHGPLFETTLAREILHRTTPETLDHHEHGAAELCEVAKH